jgi:hypothetical protein
MLDKEVSQTDCVHKTIQFDRVCSSENFLNSRTRYSIFNETRCPTGTSQELGEIVSIQDIHDSWYESTGTKKVVTLYDRGDPFSQRI